MTRKMMFSVILTAALIVAFHPAAWPSGSIEEVKENGALVAGVRNDAPPFGYLDPVSGEVVGIDVDLARSVANRLNVPLKIRIVTPQTWIPYLINRNVDLVAATVTANPDREKLVDFSLAYFKTSQRVLARKGTVKSLEDLAGKKIGTTQGTDAEKEVRNQIPSASCYFFSDSGKAVEALRKGEIDAISASGSVLYGCLAALSENEYEIPGSVKLSEDGFRIAVRKGDGKFLDLVNSTLADLNAKGDAKKIFDKWFRKKETDGTLAGDGVTPQALGVVTRKASADRRFLVLPIEGVFRPNAAVSIFDPQGNSVGEGTVASIYEEEAYIDAPDVPKDLIQPGFTAMMGYNTHEARKHIRSQREVIDRVIKASNEEKAKIQRQIAQEAKQETREREKFQEEMTKTKMYLDYQYSDYYYRYR